MSLSVGVLTILHEDGETELEARGKIFRIGSLMSCDLILNEPEAKRIHCEITSDSFGRITVTNYSKRNPVLLDGNPLAGTRPLFTGSVVQIFDKKLRWINKDRHPRNETITPRTKRLTKQAPYSASDVSRKMKLSKRNTMHSFGQRIDDTLDSDLDRSTNARICDRQSRMSMSAALKTVGATPPRCIKTPSKEKNRRSKNFEPATRFDSDDKENSQQVVDNKNSILFKCQPSAMLVTSFSPSTTPTRTPTKSFALVTANKSTPKSVYSTPRSILSDLNNEGECGATSTPPNTPPVNVYLIDFTTPDVYRTPLQKRTPLIRSVLKNSVTKSTAKTVTRSPLPVKQSNSPVSTKKIRFESPTSTKKAVLVKTPAKIETSKTYSTPNRANLSKSSATKKPLNVSGFAATTTPTSLTKHNNSPQILSKIGSAAKTPLLASKRKSSNCSISTPLKTPKAIFGQSAEIKNATPTKIPVVCRSSSARTSTQHSTTPVGIGNRSVNKNATLDRSVTFIMDSPQNSNKNDHEDQDVDSKSDSTFTFEDSIEIPETQDQRAEVADIDDIKSIDSFAESRRSLSKRFSLLSTTLSVSCIDIEPTPEDTMEGDIKAEEKRQSGGKSSRRQSEIDVTPNFDRNESVEEKLSPDENPLNQTFDKDDHDDEETVDTSMKEPDCMEIPKRKSLRSRESTNLDIMNSEDVNPAENAATQQTPRVTSRKSLKSPKLFGVRELLKSPKSPIEVNFVGLKELVQSPHDNLGLSDLIGVKEMYNTPVKDELDNLVGVKELVKTPKTQRGLDDVRGLKEMYNTPYRDDLTDVFGVKELLNTPKANRGLENPRSLRELYKTPIRDDLTDVRGVKELLKTPNIKSPQLKGVREMLKTPQLKSPELKGICEMYKTPKLPTYEDTEGINDVFKTPSSRSIMILNTPKSVVIENRASLVADLMKTPEQVDLHDDLDKMDSLFKTPLSEIAGYSGIEKDPAKEENLTTDETFDKLVGKPIIRRTYERSPVKQLMLAVPLQEAANDDNVKTDIQEWIENINTSSQETYQVIEETVKDSAVSENPETISPSIDSNRKPLAASSSIKPLAEVRRSTRRRQFSIDQELNEMSGIEKLNESACSTNQICIGCDGKSGVGTTPRTPRKSVTTPRKSVGTPTRSSSARRALKVTPQIRRLRGQSTTPYSTRKAGGNSSAKGLFDELSIQFIDETTIADPEVDSSLAVVNEKSDSVSGNVGSTLRSITLNEYEPSEPNDDDLEFISVVDSFDESRRRIPRKTQSGEVISISDDEESETDDDKANKTEETVPINTTVEFVALNELSVSSEQNIGTPASDVFKINRSRIQEMDTINESQNELETPDHSILTVGNITTLNIHQEQAVAEEALLEQYELEASKEEDMTCQTMEAVYLHEQMESSCLEKSLKNNKRTTIDCDSSVEFNECNDTLWRSVAGQQTPTDPINLDDDDDDFANFEPVPRVLGTRLSQPEASLKSGKTLRNRRTVGQPSLSKVFDLETERKRHELSMELKDFESHEPQSQRPAKRGQTLTPPAKTDSIAKDSLTRRTMGDKTSTTFDVEKAKARFLKSHTVWSQTSRKRHELSMELKDFESHEPQSQRSAKRGQTLTPPAKTNSIAKDSLTRRTMGDKTSTTFDVEKAKARFLESHTVWSQTVEIENEKHEADDASKTESNKITYQQEIAFEAASISEKQELQSNLSLDQEAKQSPEKRASFNTKIEDSSRMSNCMSPTVTQTEIISIKDDEKEDQEMFDVALGTEDQQIQLNLSSDKEDTKQSPEKRASLNTMVTDSPGKENAISSAVAGAAVTSTDGDESLEIKKRRVLIEDNLFESEFSLNDSRHVHFGENEYFNITKPEIQPVEEVAGKKRGRKMATAGRTPAKGKGRAVPASRNRKIDSEEKIQQNSQENAESGDRKDTEDEPIVEGSTEKPSRRARKPSTIEPLKTLESAEGNVKGLDKEIQVKISSAEVPKKTGGRQDKKADSTETLVYSHSHETELNIPQNNTALEILPNKTSSRRGRKQIEQNTEATTADSESKEESSREALQVQEPATVKNNRRGRKIEESIEELKKDPEELNAEPVHEPIVVENPKTNRRGRKVKEPVKELKEEPEEVSIEPAQETPVVENSKINRRGRKAKEPVKKSNDEPQEVAQETPVVGNSKTNRRGRKVKGLDEKPEEVTVEPAQETPVIENVKTNCRGKKDKEPVKEGDEELREVSIEPPQETPVVENPNNNRRGRKAKEPSNELNEKSDEASVEPALETPVGENTKGSRRGRKAKEPVKQLIAEPEEVSVELVQESPNMKSSRRGRKAQELSKESNQESDEMMVEPIQETHVVENTKSSRRGKKDKEPIEKSVSENIESAQETSVVENAKNNRRGRKAKEAAKESNQEPEELLQETPIVENAMSNRRGRKAKEPAEQLIEKPECDNTESAQETPVVENAKNNRRGRKAKEAEKESNQEPEEPLQETPIVENAMSNRRGRKAKEPVEQFIEKPDCDNTESAQETPVVENAKNNRRGRKAKETGKELNQEPEEPLQETPIVENAMSNRRGRKAKEPVEQLIEKPERDNTESAQETPVVENAKNRRGKKVKEAAKESNQKSEEIVVEPLQETPIIENAMSNRRGRKAKEPVGQFIETQDRDNTESAQETPVVENAKYNRRGRKAKEPVTELNKESQEVSVEPAQEMPLLGNAKNIRRGRKAPNVNVPAEEQSTSKVEEIAPISSSETPDTIIASTKSRGRRGKHANSEEATKITQPPSAEPLAVQIIEDHEIPPTKRTKLLQETVVEASPVRRGRSARNIVPTPEVIKPSRKRRV